MVDPTLVVVLVVFALRMLLVVSPPPRPVEPTLAVSTQSLDNDSDIAHSRLSEVAVCQPREAGAWHRSPIATAGSDF